MSTTVSNEYTSNDSEHAQTSTDAREQVLDRSTTSVIQSDQAATKTLTTSTDAPITDIALTQSTWTTRDVTPSTEAAHDVMQQVFSAETTDDKPFYERHYFVVITSVIASVLAVLLIMLYSLTMVVCQRKDPT